MNKTINPARRQFLIQSAGASGGLALGLYFPQMASAQNTNTEAIPLKTPNEINVIYINFIIIMFFIRIIL